MLAVQFHVGFLLPFLGDLEGSEDEGNEHQGRLELELDALFTKQFGQDHKGGKDDEKLVDEGHGTQTPSSFARGLAKTSMRTPTRMVRITGIRQCLVIRP